MATRHWGPVKAKSNKCVCLGRRHCSHSIHCNLITPHFQTTFSWNNHTIDQHSTTGLVPDLWTSLFLEYDPFLKSLSFSTFFLHLPCLPSLSFSLLPFLSFFFPSFPLFLGSGPGRGRSPVDRAGYRPINPLQSGGAWEFFKRKGESRKKGV